MLRTMSRSANLAIACPCGNPEIRCKGLCARCYEAQRLDRRKFGGQRDIAVARDGRACILCRSRNIIVHHRDPARNEAEAFATLCRHCHPRIHSLHILPYGVTAIFAALWWEQHRGQTEQLELPFVEPAPPPEQLPFAFTAVA